MSNILISGDVSNFSQQLAHRLLKDSSIAHVVQLNNYSVNNNKLSQSLISNSKFKLLNISSSSAELLVKALQDNSINVLIDCSFMSHMASIEDAHASASHFLQGVTNLVEACRIYSKLNRFILTSGFDVYGNNEIKLETTPLTPVTVKGASMMACEAMAHSYAMSYRLPIVIGRIDETFDKSVSYFQYLLNIEIGTKAAPVYNITGQSCGDKLRAFVESDSTNELLEDLVEFKPKVLIFGSSPFDLNKMGFDYVNSEAPVNPSDKNIKDELDARLPSHVLYFISDDEDFEGNCFRLRDNVSVNLYTPWLLASECERRGLHFTIIGALSTDSEETSAKAVQKYTKKMLEHFNSTLTLKTASLEADSTKLQHCSPYLAAIMNKRITGFFDLSQQNCGNVLLNLLK